MDTIDNNVMQAAAEVVIHSKHFDPIFTVTVTLNGAHGGADVTVEGFDTAGNFLTSTTEIH